MTTTTRPPEIEHTVQLLGGLFAPVALDKISFKLWDGTMWPDEKPRAGTIVLKHPGAVREMFAAGTEKGLAEAFLHDDFDVEGEMEAACELADALAENADGEWLQAARQIFHLRRPISISLHSRAWTAAADERARRQSRARERKAVALHYDVPNDFFRLWLDSKMLWSCAYFEKTTDDLETAQTAKLQHLCRKLRLQPRARLLDIGCGWGGLAIHAAQSWGAQVVGVTLSEQQASLASTFVGNAGLAKSVTIELKNYRDLHEAESYDAIASVGMAEHVGVQQLATYFKKAFSLLKPGGVFLNHAIGDGVRARRSRGPSFIQEYVFPDSDLPPLSHVLGAAESAGFEVRDVENLCEHYAAHLAALDSPSRGGARRCSEICQ